MVHNGTSALRHPSTHDRTEKRSGVFAAMRWSRLKTRNKRRRRSFRTEQLEPRVLLDADPILSEFMPRNRTTITDEDGAFSDWIELHNQGDAPADLSGYYLTNDAGDPTAWAIPAGTSLAAGEYLTVFASGKDRAVAGSELHTDFELGELGGYMALVEPNGTTIVNEYVDYPALGNDQSYGLVRASGDAAYVLDGDTGSVLIPADGSLGNTWTGGNEPFDDAAWLSGPSGFGFETIPGTTEFDVTVAYSSTALSNLASADAVLAGTNRTSEHTATAQVINYFDPSGNTTEGHYVDTGNQFPGGGGDNFAVKATTTIFITPDQAGTWTFGVNSDDGSRIRIDGGDVMVDDTAHGPSDFFGQTNLTVGSHTLELVYFEIGGGAEVELFAAPGSHSAWSAGTFSLVGDPNGNLPAGSLEDFFQTDLETAMSTINASAYLRYPFSVNDPAELQSLSLEMFYDDGYVIYLNGVEVASDNAPPAPAFDASAVVKQDLTSTTIDLTSQIGMLQSGDNVLAIHGLNSAAGDTEFLIKPQLVGRALQPAAPEAFNVPTPGAMNGQLEPLITEFQASNQNTLEDEDGTSADWIEIHNPGSVDVNLGGWYLTDTQTNLTRWQIPNTWLPAGEYLLVYASNKDRAVSGQPLHTDFRLSAGGEYVALVRPDGSVAWEYAEGGLDYPFQFEDVSYGLAQLPDEDPGEEPGDDTEGVTAYWDFEDGSGTQLTDRALSGFHGTLNNMEEADWSTDAAVGSYALRFDGGSEFVSTLATASQLGIGGDAPRTVAGWAKATFPAGTGGVFEVGSGTGESLAFRTTNTIGLSWAVQHTSTLNQTISQGRTWFHFAITYDGSDVRLYVDGAEVNQSTGVALNTNDNGAFNIGSFGSLFFKGLVDDLAVWNYSLPAGDIADLSNQVVSPLDFVPASNRPLGTTVDGFTVRQANASASFPGVVTGEIGGDAGSGADPLADADALLALDPSDPGVDGSVAFEYDQINFYETVGGGDNGLLDDDEPFPLDEFTEDDDHFALVATATLVVEPGEAGEFIFAVHSDEGSRLKIGGTPVITDNTLHAPSLQQSAAVNLTEGEHALELVFFERTGGAELELLYASATGGVADAPFELIEILPSQQVPDVPTNIYQAPRVYFPEPTPAADNNLGVEHFVGPTVFSLPAGYFDTPQTLAILNNTPGVEIRYTTNGTEPTATTGTVYAGPLTVSSTSVIRAAAFLDGADPSDVETASYFFVSDVILQSSGGEVPSTYGFPASGVNGQEMNYGIDPDIVGTGATPANSAQFEEAILAIPTISMVTDGQNLFDASTGIYVNAGQRGRAWEREASLELINPDGSEGFQIDAGVRIRGGFSRNGGNPKHAFRLFFRSEYGDAKLNFPLFGDEGADTFDAVDLRTSQNYSWAFGGDARNNFMRDIFSRDMMRELGQPYTRGRFYHLYINGQYWGLYQTEERPEADYAESYFGGDEEDYDVIKNDPRAINTTDGNLEAYQRLADYFYQEGGLSDANIADYFAAQGMNPDGTRNAAFERLLDVDNLIDYMIVTYYTSDHDGPGSKFTRPGANNYFGIYNRENPDGFKFFEHDSEHSLDTGNTHSDYNMVSPFTNGGESFTYFNAHWMHEQLANENSEYRQRFMDRVYEVFFNDGPFTEANVLAMINARAAEIESAIFAESARWGDSKQASPRTVTDWQNSVNTTRSWVATNFANTSATTRIEEVIRQFREETVNAGGVSWYSSVDPPGFSETTGEVDEGTLLSLSVPGQEVTVDTTLLSGATPGPTTGEPATYFVAEDDSLGIAWTFPGFDDTGWTSGRLGVGYETGSGYESLIGSDVETQMFNGTTTSVYMRVPFNVADVSNIDQLTLGMRYDDGFIAYLNGTEVARSTNVQGTAPPNMSTPANHEGDSFEQFDITAFAGGLVVGDNLLAIHGVNTSTTSSDMIFLPEITSSQVFQTEGSGAIWYTTDGTDPRASGGDAGATAISYNQTQDVIEQGDAISYFIPPDGTLGTTWTAAGFDDAAWTSGTNGVGFDLDPDGVPVFGPGFLMKVINSSTPQIGDITTATGMLDGTTSFTGTTMEEIQPYVNHGTSGGGRFSSPVDMTPPSLSGDTEDYAIRATANVTIPVGTWTVAVSSDDGFRLTIPGVTFTNEVNTEFTGVPNPGPDDVLVYAAVRGLGDTLGTFTVSGAPLETTLQLDFYERGGGDTVELSVAQNQQTTFNSGTFQVLQDGTLGWTVEAEGIAHNLVDYAPEINTDIGTAMHPGSSSAYVRIPFTVTDAAEVSSLGMNVKYDDGFVAYLNGAKVAERNAPASPAYDSIATATRDDNDALRTESISLSAFLGNLVEGNNVLAVHVLNRAADNTDLLMVPELTISRGGLPFAIDQSGPVMARVQIGGEWSPLRTERFLVGATTLMVSEINYNPDEPNQDELNAGFVDGEQFEFIELLNVGSEPVDMGGVRFTGGISFDFTGSGLAELAAGERVVLVSNQAGFEERYGTEVTVAGVYSGQLDNAGERITLVNALDQPIFDFSYNDAGDWPGRADGDGFTLELIDPSAVPETEPERTDYLEDGDNWHASRDWHGSPGAAGLTPRSDVVVNEVLSNTDSPGLLDTIELHNTSAVDVDISGWYLSDSTALTKYRIPDATILPAGGYLLFDETQFNPAVPAPEQTPFGLNGAEGDDVWLMEADAVTGALIGFVDHVDFGAAVSDESFGRWPNGSGPLAPMTSLTLGGDNSGPRLGPAVISEVMYNPPAATAAELLFEPTLTDEDFEFVELFNPTGETIDLEGWRLDNGVDLVFRPGTTLEPGEVLVAVSFNPDDAVNSGRISALLLRYPDLSADVLVGPWDGQLNNGGETVQLERPDTPVGSPPVTPYVLVDHVRYDDDQQWPTAPDGTGDSLARTTIDEPGTLVGSWAAHDPPSPGQVNLLTGRYLFYGNSVFATAGNDDAIATDKSPLLPGRDATGANYSNFNLGINGVTLDLFGLSPTDPDASDFALSTGNSSDPSSWTGTPTGTVVTVRRGEGVGGADRIELTWPDNTIDNTWLEIVVKATSNTNLLADQVFYFGNAVGETGNSNTNALVTAADVIAVRDNPRGAGNRADVENPFDLNRDQLVDATDRLLARNNATSPFNAVRLIEPPLPTVAPAPPEGAEGEPVQAPSLLSLRSRKTNSLAAGAAEPVDALLATQTPVDRFTHATPLVQQASKTARSVRRDAAQEDWAAQLDEALLVDPLAPLW